MLRHKLYCRDIASLLSALIVVTTESRIFVTVFFIIFFNNVAIEKLFVMTKFSLSAIELCLSFVATFSCWLELSSFGLFEFCVATYENHVTTKTARFSTFVCLFFDCFLSFFK